MLTCSSCGHLYAVSGLHKDSLTRCPKCQNINRVKEYEQTLRPQTPPVEEKAAPHQALLLGLLAFLIFAIAGNALYRVYQRSRLGPSEGIPTPVTMTVPAPPGSESPGPSQPATSVLARIEPPPLPVRKIPEDPGYESLAEAFLAMGDAESVLHLAEQVKGRLPYVAEARLIRAESFLKKGSLEEARKTFEELLETHPEHPEAWLGLAQIMDKKGLEPLKVATSYKRFLAYAPPTHKARETAQSRYEAVGQKLFAWKNRLPQARKKYGTQLLSLARTFQTHEEDPGLTLALFEKLRLARDGLRLLEEESEDSPIHSGAGSDAPTLPPEAAPQAAPSPNLAEFYLQMAWQPSTPPHVRPVLYRDGLAYFQNRQAREKSSDTESEILLRHALALFQYLTHAYPLAAQTLEPMDRQQQPETFSPREIPGSLLQVIRQALHGLLHSKGLDRFRLAGTSSLEGGATFERYELDREVDPRLPWEEVIWILRQPETGHGRVYALTSLPEEPEGRRWALFEHLFGQAAAIEDYGSNRPETAAVSDFLIKREKKTRAGSQGRYRMTRYAPAAAAAKSALNTIRMSLEELNPSPPPEPGASEGAAFAFTKSEIFAMLPRGTTVLADRVRLLASAFGKSADAQGRSFALLRCQDGPLKIKYAYEPGESFLSIQDWESQP